MTQLPSIRGRLARALVGWSIAWAVAVAGAVWLAVEHEVSELLDDTLQASADVLGGLLVRGDAPAADPREANGAEPETRFAWQVVGPDARLLLRSRHAPASPLHASATPGFSRTTEWRTYGRPLGADGRILYVAQTREERREAQAEITLSTALAALAIGLLGHLWLRRRVRQELLPLERLSDQLAGHEPLQAGASLGAPERDELQPVHAAIEELVRRLALRVARERAFTAHAAHSLRTPLAGIDTQLAVALRECPPELQPRLRRVREAAGRLQRVVAALLALFRSGAALQRQPVDLHQLMSQLTIHGIEWEVLGRGVIDADGDLLAAALLNLIDNSLRCGAHKLVVDVPSPGTLRIADDGPGVSHERRQELQAALDSQAYEGRTGLGLMLSDLVARSHGGALRLPPAERGFAVELQLGEP
ncbi:histidine kinase dimerization/phospho-acceptor domain-containing protein [Piscinibacter sp. XHJ-5]|uniref:sensor histidine kinase n=1 Tax=Piscinibacter sp. XHJ-5 TaxID=3037797 RepID=UPI00245323D2|nr:histidine kinase dimerization/phospho-acceptor domain-containing protein [Piscinibacter sp. XHJ-5]